jgi:hypothetical protein
VPEAVLDGRIEGPLVHELASRERVERSRQLRLGKRDDASQHRLGELLPDHRRRLENPLFLLREPVDARGQHRLHGARDHDRVDRPDQAVGALRPGEVPGLDQRLHRLLDEERVAARPLLDALRQARERRVGTEEIAQQLADRVRGERLEGDLPAVGSVQPVGLVLGPVADEHERARAGDGVDELLAESLAPAVDPVQVLEQEHRRSAPALRVHELLHDAEELALACLGVEPRAGTLGIGHAEELEDERQRGAELLVEQHERAGDLPARALVAVLLGHAEVGAQQLEHREERDELSVRHAVRLVDGEPARPTALHELPAEPALPDPGLAHHAHHLPVAGDRARERGLERRRLVLASHEAREAARPGHLEAGAERAHAGQLVDPQRGGHALHRHRAQLLQPEEAGDERRRVLGQVDLPDLGDLLHPRGEPDGVAEGGVVHAEIVADPAHHHLARVEPHADGEVEPALQAEPARVAAQLLGEMQRRVAGAPGVVLVRDGRAEERHDAVAGVLVDRALETMDAVGQDHEEAVHDAVPLLGIDPRREVHRALHVDEEHGHLLALALEGGAEREDLLGEVLRRVGGGRALGGHRRRAGQRRAAAPAELLRGLHRRATRRTGPAETPAALRAEAAIGTVLVTAGRAAGRADRA